MDPLTIKIRYAEWMPGHWNKAARLLASEASLRAEVSERQMGTWLTQWLNPRRTEALTRDAEAFRFLAEELGNCLVCEHAVKSYYEVLERSWDTPYIRG
jgi:hypothetical protein